MHFENLLVARVGTDNRIALVTLNRSHVLNAMNTAMGLELRDLFHELRHDREVRCVVITGAGNRAFCTGADLKERVGMSDEAFQRQHEIFEEAFFEQLLGIDVPTIAAVEGYCIAGGFELALACDFIVGSETSTFALTEVLRGIFPGGGATQFLPRLLGKAFTKEMIFTAARLDAAEAHRRGIINHLIPAGKALDKALALAEQIGKAAPIAIRQAKKAIDRGSDMDLRNGLVLSIEAYNAIIPTEDRREGMLAFNEKREPRFQGR